MGSSCFKVVVNTKAEWEDNWPTLSLAIYPSPESRIFLGVRDFHILLRLKQENSIRTALSNLHAKDMN